MHFPYWERLFVFAACFLTTCAQTSPFDAREATISTVHNDLFSGLTTCRAIVESFIVRIEAFNPTINAISSLNPDALSIADDMDTAIAMGNVTGSLFCVPILLKDNYDAAGINTTGSCLGFAGMRPSVDSPAAAAFRREGAIILGKSSLHEMALEGLSVSSYGGQVVNPYDYTRTPGGSSGGTGAAIASSLAVFGTGTDTVNSLRNPASAGNLFSFRPTRGLISRTGILPISFTQDTIGAIGRCVEDIAVAMTVMSSVGYDAADNATALVPPSSRDVDYSASLYGSNASVKGKRFGLIDGFLNKTSSNETNPVTRVISKLVSQLEAAGATIVNITSPQFNATAISADCDVQQFEYRQELDAYLSRPSLTGKYPSTMEALYRNTSSYLVIPSQHAYVSNALVSSTTSPSNITTYQGRLHNITNLQVLVSEIFTAHSLDAMIYPQQSRLVVPIGSPSQSGRNGILSAVTGFPVVDVPIGFSEPTSTAPIGIPIGLDILGLPWTEREVLGIAKGMQDLLRARRMPPGALNGTVEVLSGGYTTVPSVTPVRDASPNYPIGTL